ncbi:MAG: hypothetical protein ACT6UH_00565 [Hydrogenophaga sp.]|uniref:hypothetical protein n=1 Tax=Hydrogenophaga sp. TaxID=1904254 RepID=UPI004036C8D0
METVTKAQPGAAGTTPATNSEAGGPKAGAFTDLRIGQHLRHRDYKGERVTGIVRCLSVESEQGLMVEIALDAPIVIPAHGDFHETRIYRQFAPAHEFLPFDERDELIAELQSALQGLLQYHDDVPKAANQQLLDAGYSALARVAGVRA